MSKSLTIDQSELKRLVENVDTFHSYFSENYKRYHSQRRFLFKSTSSESEKAVLARTNKPHLEFNIGEAYISRLLGEFSKQEPSYSVSANEGQGVDLPVLQFVEGNLRYVMTEANLKGFEYNTYKQTMSGGFSAWKIWTEYQNSMSFDQVIKFGQVFDPTLVGFDMLARLPTKSDGNFCFEIFPKTKEELKAMGVDVESIRYADKMINSNNGYNWSYRNGKKDFSLVCDYYEKEIRKVSIVLLPENNIMREKDYNKMVKDWQTEGKIEQVPRVVARRKADTTTIIRYWFTQNEIIKKEETDFEDLPIIFVDGNSELIKESESSSVEQMTRGYTYNLRGAQKLKDFAGQALGGELQNIVQHKWVVAKEAIPAEYKDAYIDVQVADVLIYNHLYKNDPAIVLPPPREVVRTQIPPQITETFQMMDSLSQVILGSFDASLGINDNQLSGIAIEEGATQSNAAAMPYIVSFLHALNQLAEVYKNLLPKFVKTPRTMPVLMPNGKKGFVDIQKGFLNYEPSAISVKVEAGVNFEIQKSRALREMVMMAKEMPIFGQFINEKGLQILVDNLGIKGADQIKEAAADYMKEMEQKKQQMANQPNPEMIQIQQNEKRLQIDAAKVGISEYEAETNRMSAEARAREAQQDIVIKESKNAAENIRTAAELAINQDKHHHTKAKDIAEHQHKINLDMANLNKSE